MQIFVGYDSREDIAFQVCEYSLRKNTQVKLDIAPLSQKSLREQGVYWREHDSKGSTEFTFTRFLVPCLTGYQGWALFCDCDFLWVDDVHKLFDLADEKYAVMCVQHDYQPTAPIKMDGQHQYQYPRKNWSSMILWNCGHPKNETLSPDIVNTAPGQYLHRFSWLDDNDIGIIDHKWNWLVGWYTSPADGYPSAIHYTEGGPWFENYTHVDYADEWIKYKNEIVPTRSN